MVDMDKVEIVVGTYENLILGYQVVKNIKGDYNLDVSFTDDSHRGALRCMSVSSNGTLVSSSTDDSIRLHSLTKRKDIGGLFEHTGTVNSISFYGSSHMFSGSEDGTICIWKCRSWEMLRTLKGHKAYVTAMSVHPSGKLGLSAGSDKSFLTWDLVTGKLAFQRKLKEMAQNVLFTSEGDHYVLVYQKNIEVCSLEDTQTVQEISTNWRINSVCFVDKEIVAVGGDDKSVLIVNVLSGDILMTLDCLKPGDSNFNSRVRCVCCTKSGDATLVIVGMANGNIAIFKVIINQELSKSELVIFHETKVRLTCMAVHNVMDIKIKEEKESESVGLKRKKQQRSREKKDKKETLEVQTDSADNTKEDNIQTSPSEHKNKKIRKPQSPDQVTKKRKLDAKQEKTSKPKKDAKPLSRNEKHKRKVNNK
ncbi:p21-activated protein kinase-interacting protein 1-like [Biomphalaria glabrata]|uniref:P21-activated protein kinase-interacting protein 1-like n=1 Tax=Biomphalaria glabrata TaxID=6526 RepID=A0A2C9LFR3_BIOGL|nr:p21-activated protein kinase-interacting protein 1-like [Biomphalaria glabrata]KAI8773716.1 p21-activated protein kinase-interacting protein 1 [Biomphalaria glabrata]